MKKNTPISFSGTSYLGMNQHLGLRQFIVEGLERYGNNYGGSRNGNTAPMIYREAEDFLSKWLGVPQSVLVSSGTLAAYLIKEVITKDYECFYEPDIHPSVRIATQEERERTDHAFRQHVFTSILSGSRKPFAIFLNAIDPLFALKKDFGWLTQLPKGIPLLIAIDDSHGIGVLGDKGQGIIQQIRKLDIESFIIYGSLGKAPGIPAGFITGSNPDIVAKIKNSSIFAGASPPLPAYAYAFQESGAILQSQLSKLMDNIRYFTRNIPSGLPLRFIADYPAFYSSDELLGRKLARQNIIISSFAYPSKDGPLLNRIVLNAGHTRDDLDRCLEAVVKTTGI